MKLNKLLKIFVALSFVWMFSAHINLNAQTIDQNTKTNKQNVRFIDVDGDGICDFRDNSNSVSSNFKHNRKNGFRNGQFMNRLGELGNFRGPNCFNGWKGFIKRGRFGIRK